MRYGYFTMPLHPPGADPAQTLADDLEQIVALDELGFAEAWIGEHFTSVWENIPCPDLFIAQALARTQRIVLGTGGFPGDCALFDVDTERLEQRGITRDVLDTVLALWDSPQPGVYQHARWRFRVPEPQPDIGLQL